MITRVLILAMAAMLTTPVVSAQQFPGSTWAPQGQKADQDVPLPSVLRSLRQEYGGQHLDARKRGSVYEIKWIAEDGRRLVIEVDAGTGRKISVRG